MADITGTPGNDSGPDALIGTNDPDTIMGLAGADELRGLGAADNLTGGAGNDDILGGLGDDIANQNISTDGADAVNLGAGSDAVLVSAAAGGQVRLAFTSAEVGNGNVNDSNTLANQDGGLALRMQLENGAGNPAGALSRTDDEGITFVSTTAGLTFDVRDLVSGAQRGDQFEVVRLGTSAGETLDSIQAARPYYINAGAGDDTVNGGNVNDFLVGGAGNDTLVGFGGNDSFIGGGGIDLIQGQDGGDTAIFNISNDGADRVNLGSGNDVVLTSAATAGQIRLTFTSAEVGNGLAADSNTLANQDGGLAVRMQAEDGSDGLVGAAARLDDEGITFVATTAGVTFDVRDLVSGVQRGDQFEVVTLGSNAADTLSAVQNTRPYYFNAGQGDDTITDGTANDFLVGGAGNDTLTASAGNDSFIGGGGNDAITGGDGSDRAIFNVTSDGADSVNLGADSDVVLVSAAAAGQVRLTFTSAEVGNGNANDGGALPNQDGGLAVRFQAENGSDGLIGPVSRLDDEGITFVSTTPGLAFDVRDLVSGAARGDRFEVVTLGTSGADQLFAIQAARPYYINAGGGNDFVQGGIAADFLVGGAGSDVLRGQSGIDTLLGGGGDDTYLLGADADLITDTGGYDTAASTVTRSLAPHATVERLVLQGANNINGAGNALDNAIFGNAARNTLVGGDGDDTLTGRLGRDILTGGAGDDTFDFNAVAETGTNANTRDAITDFVQGEDTIDLSTIDADGILPLNQFVFRGQSAFSGLPGELRFFQIDGAIDQTIVEGNVNGDTVADFQIRLTGLIDLTAGDFNL